MTERAGSAVAAGAEDDPLSEVVRDYGDPDAEYAAVRAGAGVADRDDLGVIALSGRDPVRMVQGLITGDLAGAPPERAVYGALLTPKGRTIAEARALKVPEAGGDHVWMLIPREVFGDAVDHLRRSVPPLYARWRDASDEIAVLGVYGPRSAELLDRVLGVDVAGLDEDTVVSAALAEATVRIVGTRYSGGEPGYDLVLPRDVREGVRNRLLEAGDGGARLVGFAALEVLRIEAGLPRGGRELTQESIPTEAFEAIGMMERAISFTKGCYTGQEVIVRIAHRGHVNRHLRGLVLPLDATAAAGARLYHPESGKEVGWTTSAAESPLMGGPIALGYVRREVEPGSRVRVGSAEGAEATVVALPFGAGA